MFPFTCCPTPAPLQIQLSQKKKKNHLPSLIPLPYPSFFCLSPFHEKGFYKGVHYHHICHKVNEYFSRSHLTQPLCSFQLKDHPFLLEEFPFSFHRNTLTRISSYLPDRFSWRGVLGMLLHVCSLFPRGLKKLPITLTCTSPFDPYIQGFR